MAADVRVQDALTGELKKLLHAADARILSAQDDNEAILVCKESHEQVAALLVQCRKDHEADDGLLQAVLKGALQGMETAVPVPPVPPKQPDPAPVVQAPARDELPAQDVKSTNFTWRFLACGHNVVSVLQAGQGSFLLHVHECRLLMSRFPASWI